MEPLLIPRAFRVCFLSVTLALTAVSCREKADIQYKTDQIRLSLSDLQMQKSRLDAELATVRDLGKYNSTNQVHVSELKSQIESFKADITRLKAQRDSAKAKVEEMQSVLDSYRAKYVTR